MARAVADVAPAGHEALKGGEGGRAEEKGQALDGSVTRLLTFCYIKLVPVICNKRRQTGHTDEDRGDKECGTKS